MAPPISTDHVSMLHLEITLPTVELPHECVGLRRFYMGQLESAVTQSNMITLYNSLSDILDMAASESLNRLPGLSVHARQELIETMDTMIVDAISMVCEHTLGSYLVSSARMQPDRLLFSLAKAPSPATAIRLYKRSRRTQSTTIHSRSPSVTPIEDAMAYYTQVFHQPHCAWRPDTQPIPFYNATGDYDIATVFGTDSIASWIKKYPADRSCGSDSLHVCILRALLPSHMVKHLSSLFTMCALTGLTPRRWNQSLVFPIPKKQESRTIAEHRPIALTQMFRRLFEMGLLSFLRHHPSTNAIRKLDPSQAGFRSGFSTLTQALVSHEASMGRPVHQVFLDLKMAYDSVPVPILLEKLTKRAASPGLLSLVSSLFLDCSSEIVINNAISSPIRRERGLFQGSILAPFLFDLFIDDLAEELNSVELPNPLPHALFFADDIKLHHREPWRLQAMLDICYHWCISNGMTINIEKSAVLSTSDLYLTIGTTPLP